MTHESEKASPLEDVIKQAMWKSLSGKKVVHDQRVGTISTFMWRENQAPYFLINWDDQKDNPGYIYLTDDWKQYKVLP